ncbi:polysaccharide deacetylase family protein [Flagellimonas myxillae]|uniref:polysaccharide deacetylase family protein n=1 Tax=Flagellimonas myxillae TaxID=2942214 RepID=UPI00201F57D0|nr:polysaccharide deacetylase family protein [Muricauda myxillae]MCL6267660.1 polysaccharide deacetylase family protein [Muricauda myxillae]
MKFTQITLGLLAILWIGCKPSTSEKKDENADSQHVKGQPMVSFTFDDGITSDLAGYPFREWNQMLLSHLENADLKATFFVTGRNKLDEDGQFLLKSWNDKGHQIANHTFSHPNFNADANSAQVFVTQLQRTDSIISAFGNSVKLFRFPYLKEGQNAAKVDSIRNILAKHGYRNGYVTIDASDWYVNSRLIQKIKANGISNTQIDAFRDFYVQHILERAGYYEELSMEMNGRHIQHTLLLHHNLTSALFLGDLIKAFKAKGWKVVDADKAFQDPIFEEIPDSNFAGESLIWSWAKQSGNYEARLRYPAEDSRYEKEKMDKIGL